MSRLSLRSKFVDALCNEIRQRKDFFNGLFVSSQAEGIPAHLSASVGHSVIRTVYFGGGTPSVLEPQMLERICAALRENFNLEYLEEFTIELNPNDVTPEYASFLKKLGVDRVSMGVQSFDDAHLQWMNRRHNAAQAVEAFRILRAAGFSNISCDLIFGFPFLTGDSWKTNILLMLSLRPEHISCYQMSVESGTPLARLLGKPPGRNVECNASESVWQMLKSNGGEQPLEMPSQEECAAQYALLQKMLSEAGYRQYEISNFCLPGYHSRHNSSYWNNVPYLGLGPAAHSFSAVLPNSEHPYGPDESVGNCPACRIWAFREWNAPVLQRYLDCHLHDNHCENDKESFIEVDSGAMNGTGRIISAGLSSVKEKEILTEKDLFNEMLMLGLRQTKGLDLAELERSHYYEQIKPGLQILLSQGLLEKVSKGLRLRIPSDKFFISDNIIRELFVI